MESAQLSPDVWDTDSIVTRWSQNTIVSCSVKVERWEGAMGKWVFTALESTGQSLHTAIGEVLVI